eukprot:scaffold1638_cov258-Pinguiococcus_pyrenoidosus.AAC.103
MGILKGRGHAFLRGRDCEAKTIPTCCRTRTGQAARTLSFSCLFNSSSDAWEPGVTRMRTFGGGTLKQLHEALLAESSSQRHSYLETPRQRAKQLHSNAQADQRCHGAVWHRRREHHFHHVLGVIYGHPAYGHYPQGL